MAGPKLRLKVSRCARPFTCWSGSTGESLESELLDAGEYRKGLSFLLNGRNVLSFPRKHDTELCDGDEIMITLILSGG